MRRPDGWKGILAGIAWYLASSLSFLLPVSALMAAVWHWTSARCSNPGAMCCTGNEEQHALWCHRLMNRDSGGPTHPPAPSPAPQAHFPDEKKGISRMLNRFFLHIHYWVGRWAEKCELPAESTVRTCSRDILWCAMKITILAVVSFIIFFFHAHCSLGQPSKAMSARW